MHKRRLFVGYRSIKALQIKKRIAQFAHIRCEPVLELFLEGEPQIRRFHISGLFTIPYILGGSGGVNNMWDTMFISHCLSVKHILIWKHFLLHQWS